MYNHQEIEKKWQKVWQENNLYQTKDDFKQGKYYVLDMFPYPSGEGLHVGHPKGYIATDILARQKMMEGKNVLHPMGWDAFGLPAENYALANKVHPEVAVKKNIIRFKEQLAKIGFTYDWHREVNTTDPKYYKWTQWAFLQMFKKGLAYESREPINWCPSCKTGLANEDVENGLCERCGTPVEKKPMRQWVLKITDYADRLLEDLNKLDWPEPIKESQRNWIGRSAGAEIDFKIKDTKEVITVFTTRPDTLFGVTYVVLAPENDLINKLADKIHNKQEVDIYIKQAINRPEIERLALGKEKTGIELKGLSAINPVNNEAVPIFVADYVLADYGTGAVMAVPAHDERDFEFAKKHNLEIRQVIAPFFVDKDNPPLEDKKWIPRKNVQAIIKHPVENKIIQIQWKKVPWKTLVIGGVEEGESYEEAVIREVQEETGYKNFRKIEKIGWQMESHFYAEHKNINRQAFPQVFYIELENLDKDELTEEENSKHVVAWVPLEDLKKTFWPVSELPDILEYFENGLHAFTGKGKMINSAAFDGLDSDVAKEKITKKFGRKKITYKLRDWVFSRQRYWGEPIPVVHCSKCGVVGVKEKDLPVVLPDVESYELTDTGESPLANITEWVETTCPKCGGAAQRETNTMPQWAGSSWYYLRYLDPNNEEELVNKKLDKYWSPVDMYVGGAEHATRHLIYARFWHKFLYDIGVVNYDEPFKKYTNLGLILGPDGRKMSKRWKNVINPDDMVAKYGADAFRVYEMFLSPFHQSASFLESGVAAANSFISRVINLKDKLSQVDNLTSKTKTLLNQTIKKVGEDINNFKFNTAVSALMILTNELTDYDKVSQTTYQILLQLLAPLAPHISEELWQELGNHDSIFKSSWPKYDEKLLVNEVVTIVVQVNGKMRDSFEIDNKASEEEIKQTALTREATKKWVKDEIIKKIIVVKGRVVNIVI